jgi:outer membrane protein OmpA-like peptidoglycan-associated protein
MKKLLILFLLLGSFHTINAQSYLGYTFDNYAGVQSLISNPANIVDSRFKTDINLASVSAGVTNDFYTINFSNAISNSDFKFERDAVRSPSNNNNFQTNLDIMGPSFMFNLKPKHALAISTRGRSIANVSNIDGEFLNANRDNFNSSQSFITPAQNFNLVGNAWIEFGLTYAAVLVDNQKNFFKGGLTLKYLSGLQNSYANSDNVSVNYVRNGTIKTNNFVTTTGVLTYGGNDNIGDNSNLVFNQGSGFGADLGFIYEFRPNIEKLEGQKDKNKYLIKIGASLTDFGSIVYDRTNEKKYNLSKTVNEEVYSNSNTENLLNTQYFLISNATATKYSLPTSLHFNFDWNIHNKFYLNANVDFNTINKTTINTNSIGNNYALTPRFESKWFTFSVPLNIMEYSGFQAGAAMRLGPLLVGSGSVITNFFSDKTKAIDVFVGLKIPVYQGRIKDRDNDGIVDKKDDCPDEAGPTENKGCPYKDSDRDKVLDKDDKCPDVAGAADNQGCPYPDTDKDGVLDKDDKCVNEPGEKDNQGCPYLDTDKDGVFDKDDKCPTVFGIVAKQGCPEDKKPVVIEPVKVEVAAEVIKKINEFSKTILFDTGKATLKTESNSSLDGIVTVLNEYQNANFKIEGHTDNAGVQAKNLKLSKDRAAAVKQYLIDKGVRAERLTSEGYGSKKPIASNKTPKGKNLNRRVEINLVK